MITPHLQYLPGEVLYRPTTVPGGTVSGVLLLLLLLGVRSSHRVEDLSTGKVISLRAETRADHLPVDASILALCIVGISADVRAVVEPGTVHLAETHYARAGWMYAPGAVMHPEIHMAAHLIRR